MSVLFSWRSDTSTAYYAPGGERSYYYAQGAGGTTGQIAATAPAGCIGSTVLDLNNSGVNSWVEWGGIGNSPSSNNWTVNYRFSRGAAGTLTSNDQLINFGGNSASYFCLFSAGFQPTTDVLVLSMRNELGQSGGINISIASQVINTLAMQDLTFVGQHSTTGSVLRVQCYLNGASFGSEYTFARGYNYDNIEFPWSVLTLGRNANNNVSVHYANELLIFDTALSSASISGVFTGETRTSFYSVTALQPINSTDPGVANVNSGTSYTFKGQTLTGTLSLGNYTDPGVANVAQGTNYIFADSTLTGTLTVPVATTSTADTVPIATIKEQIRYVLAVNNTSTGAPTQDLSENLSRRVQSVMKINPELIPFYNDNVIPAVTVFTDSKSPIEQTGIMKSGLSGKRKAELNFNIVGMVYAPNWIGDKTNDVADDEIEYLMENVERVLRAYDELNGNVSWQFPTAVTYHSANFDEESHFRVGVMDLKVTLHY